MRLAKDQHLVQALAAYSESIVESMAHRRARMPPRYRTRGMDHAASERGLRAPEDDSFVESGRRPLGKKTGIR